MKRNKIITSLIAVSLLNSCSLIGIGSVATQATYNNAFPEKWSEKATKKQQEEVKNQVMKLLEEEYKQPFKLEKFDYKYEKHHETGGSINFYQYGTYHFKVQVIDNPIIELEFDIKNKNKESIKNLIDSFKKDQLNDIYCVGLRKYYVNTKRTLNDKLTTEEKKANNFCDGRDQKAKYDNAWTR